MVRRKSGDSKRFRIFLEKDRLDVNLHPDAHMLPNAVMKKGVEYEHEKYKGMITYDVGFLPTLDRGEISVCIAVDSKKAVRRLFSMFQEMEFGRYNN